MANVLWRGALRFGLVTIPVGLTVAAARKEISFRTIHRACGKPIAQVRACPACGDVDPGELVKGWEYAPGVFLLVEDAELEAVDPAASRAIELLRFVSLAEVDPLYLDRTYHLAPNELDVARRPYALLRQALADTGKAAVGRFVLWGKENLCLVRPLELGLALETLYHHEDVRPPHGLDVLVGAELAASDLELARELVEKLTGPWEPDAFPNRHRAAVRAMLEQKLAGGEIVQPDEPDPLPPPPVDLTAALRQSIRHAKRPTRRKRKPAPVAH